MSEIDEITAKMERYCAYQDRSHRQADNRMREMGVADDALRGEVLCRLIENRFLDDVRFAESFVRGKYRIKKWGRIKIRCELRSHDIPERLIDRAMEQIDEDIYRNNLRTLAAGRVKAPLSYEERGKLTAYLYAKGYEYDAINEAIAGLEKE